MARANVTEVDASPEEVIAHLANFSRLEELPGPLFACISLMDSR
jgi:hypothetical protein